MFGANRHVQIDWYFERLPSSRSALAMPLDPQLHLGSARSRRSDEDHAPRTGSDSLCEATLTTAPPSTKVTVFACASCMLLPSI
jgi:hypothetical protein